MSLCLCNDACKRSRAVVREGHHVPLAGFCLSLYGLHVLNRDVNMIQSINQSKTISQYLCHLQCNAFNVLTQTLFLWEPVSLTVLLVGFKSHCTLAPLTSSNILNTIQIRIIVNQDEGISHGANLHRMEGHVFQFQSQPFYIITFWTLSFLEQSTFQKIRCAIMK